MESEDYSIVVDKEPPDVNILAAGFPGIGLVGGIASEQIIRSLEMEEIASIHSHDFPPTAVVFDGVPRRPIRFFHDSDILLVKSDMVIPPDISNSLSRTIVDWAKSLDVDEAIIFDGVPQPDGSEEKKVWGVLSSHSAESEAEKLDIDIINRGAIAGISSSLLLEAHEQKLKAVGLFAEAKQDRPDPMATIALLDKFSNYRGLDIETDTLLKSAEKLKEQYSRLASNNQEVQKKMDGRTAHPPLYG